MHPQTFTCLFVVCGHVSRMVTETGRDRRGYRQNCISAHPECGASILSKRIESVPGPSSVARDMVPNPGQILQTLLCKHCYSARQGPSGFTVLVFCSNDTPAELTRPRRALLVVEAQAASRPASSALTRQSANSVESESRFSASRHTQQVDCTFVPDTIKRDTTSSIIGTDNYFWWLVVENLPNLRDDHHTRSHPLGYATCSNRGAEKRVSWGYAPTKVLCCGEPREEIMRPLSKIEKRSGGMLRSEICV